MRKFIKYTLISIGFLLVSLSIRPIFLMIQESVIDKQLNSKYQIKELINIRNETPVGQPFTVSHDLEQPIIWKGNDIKIITNDTGQLAPETLIGDSQESPKHINKISIFLNNKEIVPSTEAWYSPDIEGDSRLLSWLQIVEITEKDQGRLAIIQRLSGDLIPGINIKNQEDNQTWRIIYINSKGSIQEETFKYTNKSKHLLGVRLVQISSESFSFIGFKSDVLTYMPSFFYPLLYPWLTFITGFIFILLGLIKLRMRQTISKSRWQ